MQKKQQRINGKIKLTHTTQNETKEHRNTDSNSTKQTFGCFFPSRFYE